MTSLEAYYIARQLVEQNAINGGIVLDRNRFVQLFNMEMVEEVSDIIVKKNDERIRGIQKLVVYDAQLSSGGDVVNGQLFNLRPDYFGNSVVNIRATKDGCLATGFHLWEAKNENTQELLADDSTKPDFEYRNSFYTIGDGHIKIFTSDFVIENAFHTYYRYPINIDLDQRIRPDETPGQMVDPELDDKIVIRIIKAVVKQFMLSDNNLSRYQIDKDNSSTPR